jgi:hypothetical protein
VAHVLGMPTGEVGDPLLLRVLAKPDDAALYGHDGQPSS